MIVLHRVGVFFMLTCLTLLVACSNGRGSVATSEEQNEPAAFTVGGAVSGLAGSGLTLQINGAGDLPISANGAFTFASSLADGAAYDVTIRSQPANPGQTCTVTSGGGRISGANVTNVAVVCSTGSTAFTVGGTVIGVTGSGLILRNNGVEDLPITADGEFIFPTPVATGAAYDVTVAMAPMNPAQTCTVENGRGVMANTDVTSVRVICSTSAFTIGGAVSGLASLGLRLRNNDEILAIGADGQFTFRNAVASGASYAVSVEAHPQGQNCIVANGSGTVQSANIANVAVTCASDVYTVGGSVTGLATGARVVLRVEAGGEGVNYEATRNGPFAFDRHLTSGTGYVVTVQSDPESPAQACLVANAAGIVNGANVTNVAVTCTTRRFTIGGTVEGLQGSGLVLRLNGANDLSVAANGSFTFETPLDSGTTYQVSVATDPATPPQTCTVQQADGTVGDRNVRDVRVTCALNTYPIEGTVMGLVSPGLVVLQNNDGDPVEVAADGAFTFATPIATGGAYNVTVRTQPSDPPQSCTVANGTGTVGAAAITNIAVTCARLFSVSVTVSGLEGAGLILRNNGVDDLPISSDGSFPFTTRLASGAQYSVAVAGQPVNPSQTCVVANGEGAVGGADVTSVSVTCTTNNYTVGVAVSGILPNYSALIVQLNAIENLEAPGNGTFTFLTAVPSGQPYSVTVIQNPRSPVPFLPAQSCSVADGSGTVGAANVVLTVTCLPL